MLSFTFYRASADRVVVLPFLSVRPCVCPSVQCRYSSDVNKDWTCKDKDQAHKDQDKDKD